MGREKIQPEESVRTGSLGGWCEVVELDWDWYDPDNGLESDEPPRGDPIAEWLYKVENGFGYSHPDGETQAADASQLASETHAESASYARREIQQASASQLRRENQSSRASQTVHEIHNARASQAVFLT